jgi:Protein of unknown function (DUF3105)
LAKKTRTPAPPAPRRPVHAPKVRTGKERAAGERRRPSGLLLALAASGIVAFAAVLAVIVMAAGGGNGGSVTAEDFLPARFTEHPTSAAGQHTNSENEKVDYSTFPPTSGRHFGATAIWGFYTEPVNPLRAVHNLEHGGIVVWYGPRVPPGEVNELREFYNEDPNAIVVTPLAGLGRRVAMSAWVAPATGDATKDGGKLLMMQQVDPDAMQLFRDEFRGRGPERLPTDSLLPGGN